MNPILVSIVILHNVSSVLSLECSDVRQSKGFGILTKRTLNGGHSHWISNKNGSEWEMHLNETKEQMFIERFDEKSVLYDKRMVNRFGYYLLIQTFNPIIKVSQMCYYDINNSSIVCNFPSNDNKSFAISKYLPINNPLIFKEYPEWDNYYTVFMAYNRKSKSDRYAIEIRGSLSDNVGFDIVIYKERKLDSSFITDMNDTLFGRIDSILDYKNNKGGWMLWFDMDDRHYYCFQPFGKSLSEQVCIFQLIRLIICIIHSIQCSSKEKLKMAFEECYQTMDETKETIFDSYKWLLIGIIFGITLAVIAVIIGVIVLVNRSNNKVKQQSPKAKRKKSSIESQSSSKQSDTLDEIARNLKPGQKFRVLRFKSEVLEKEMLSPKK